MSFANDTIAALATPSGVSAIALLRASGPRAGELTRNVFGADAPPRVAQHADYRDVAGRLVDDVIFTFFATPNSYTGEDTLEISCHGSPYIAQRILEDLVHRGCRLAEAGEFTKRAFLGGRLDLTQAEAVMDLIHARSERALGMANQQLRGSLGQLLKGMITRLVGVIASVEAYIDFPEEDLPAENRQALLRELGELQTSADRLLATAHYGALLREGIGTVILGEPNAGKSSLLNRLVGRERALVSPEPGTTRDYLEEVIRIGPHLLRLIDTAGLNPQPSAIERRGIEKAVEQAAQADLYLWVIDCTRPLPLLPRPLSDILNPANTLAVFNKTDLQAPTDAPLVHGFSRLQVSALTGFGIGELQAAIISHAESFRAALGDEAIAINSRHSLALERARSCLVAARSKVVTNEPVELLASDLRDVLDAFGEIAGRVDNEAVLDRLFSTFCIGK